MWYFLFSICLKSSLGHWGRYILLKTPPESDQWFQSYSNWKTLRTTENKRNAFVFLAVSHNQCCRLPTDPARSHIYHTNCYNFKHTLAQPVLHLIFSPFCLFLFLLISILKIIFCLLYSFHLEKAQWKSRNSDINGHQRYHRLQTPSKNTMHALLTNSRCT